MEPTKGGEELDDCSDLILYEERNFQDSMVNADSIANDMENGCAEPLLGSKTLTRACSAVPNATSQIAIIGVKRSHVESLDYENVENDVFKQDWRSRTRIQILEYIVLKWTMAFLVGTLTGLVAFAINMAVENIAGAKLMQTELYLKENRYMVAFSIFAGSNALLVVFSATLCAYIAPAAAGSGIPEVKAYLNGVDAPNILSLKTLVVKILGSIGAVAGGMDVGKEGPMVHIGSCIASFLSQGGSKHYHLTWRWLRYFKNDTDRRDLVTCGAAAGVAAAFRAPVGGVLFALEEAASWWRSALLWRAFFTTACVAIVLRLAINYCESGNCGMFGTGGLIMFDLGYLPSEVGLMELIPVVILGLIGGFLGSIFTYLNGIIVKAYSGWHGKHGSLSKLFQALLVSIITSLCLFGLPWLGTCLPCPSNLTALETNECYESGQSENYKQFTCPVGYYNDFAGLLLNTNDNVIRNLFSSNTANEFQYTSLLIFLPVSFFLALVTYGTAIPSGLFIPVIIVGAAYGRIAGKLMRSSNKFLTLDEGLYAYLGAASFLGGSMRMTVSLCVILLELTNNLLMLPLTMLVLLISKTIGDLFNHSVYDQIVHIKGLPFLQEKPEPYMKHLTVLDVSSGPPVTLSAVERVGNIVDALKMTDHNGFPVLEKSSSSEPPVLYGLVLRSHLLVLLKRKEFLSSDTPGSSDQYKQFCVFDLAKPGSGKGARIEQISLTPEEKDMFLDLHPYTNTSPYTVVENMSLAKAFSLFRQVGLRHLCVVPKTPGSFPILGILTRHDFMPEHILTCYPHLKASRWKRLRVRPSLISKVVKWWCC